MLLPGSFEALGGMQVAQVNLPVAVLIWLMIIPMLLKIDFGALGDVRRQWQGIGVTLFINWAVKPFSMALLGWIFIRHVFAGYLPADQLDSYIAGLILLAAAPCTAMVFVWSKLCDGEPNFTLTQVALNDAIMVVAFAPDRRPAAGHLVDHRAVEHAAAVGAALHRGAGGDQRVAAAPDACARWRGKLQALLQRLGSAIARRIAGHAGAAVRFSGRGRFWRSRPSSPCWPCRSLIQVYFNAGLAYGLNRRSGVAHCVAGPSALIGASNFFELAVATAVGLFGVHSGAALATVVGVLIEVPVMLSVVRIVNRSKRWYEAPQA